MPNAFIIGHPVGHSLSPILHTYWLRQYNLAGTYQAIDVSPENLPAFMDRLRNGDFIGGSVTVPHKQAVLSLCDTVEPAAAKIGAVNMLVVENSCVIGRNTDLIGFAADLDLQAPDWGQHGDSAIVLGAGGAARAVLTALAARSFKTIHILNRTPEKATQLAAQLDGPFTGQPLSAFASLAPEAALLVNTTTIGMNNTAFDDLPLHLLPARALVADIVYTPLNTPLLQQAAARGLTTIDGLGMLIHQAVPGFSAWFGIEPSPTEALRTLLLDKLGEV